MLQLYFCFKIHDIIIIGGYYAINHNDQHRSDTSFLDLTCSVVWILLIGISTIQILDTEFQGGIPDSKVLVSTWILDIFLYLLGYFKSRALYMDMAGMGTSSWRTGMK